MISICFILYLLMSFLTPSYGQATCASGWTQNGGSCYLINPAFTDDGGRAGTWDRCRDYCSHESYPGATMLCVNNAAEQSWIYSQYGGEFYWIGYTDMSPFGGGKGTKQYGWVPGCSSTYTNWYPGQPDSAGSNEDYVYVHYLKGQWKAWQPQREVSCGCQYKLALSNPPAAPSSVPTAAPSSEPTAAPSSDPTTTPTSSSNSSPTATPSFRPSSGDVSE